MRDRRIIPDPISAAAIIAALGVAVAAATAPIAAAEGPAPRAATAADDYPRRIGVDVEHYRFELTLSDESDRIEGLATVSVRFTNTGVTELLLDLAGPNGEGRGMSVARVSSDGVALEYRHEADLLHVTLPEPGRAGTRRNVLIEYGGEPATGLHIGPNRYGDRTFFSDNWPNRARNWLPTVDHPYDKATMEMVVTAPAHYQVVSNGTLVEETDGPDETRLTHWQESVPIATWLYVLGVARFAVQQVGDFRGKPIQTWVYREDRDAGFYDFAVPSRDVLDFYSERIGPYAYEKLANITSPVTGGGMEAASAIMYHEDAVTGQRTGRWRNVIIHEIAHQWFGDAVTESDWDDVWLSEGFATYFTLLFIEHAYGRDEFVAGLRSAAETVAGQYVDDPTYRIVHDDLDDMSRVTSAAIYQKGAWVLHMLRCRMGDHAFWNGIRAYYAAHMNGNATTADFRHAMEDASGQDLSAFFDQWLYSGGNPRLEGWWDYDSTARSVRIEINQAQSAGPTYTLPLEVGISFDGATILDTVQVDERFHRFVIPVDREPSEVVLDPNVRLLFHADFVRRGR